MHYYAKLNQDSIVIGVSQLTENLFSTEYIKLQTWRPELMGKQWNGSAFVDYTPPPSPIISSLEFWNRFKTTEQEAMITSDNIKVKSFLYELGLRTEVNLTWQKLSTLLDGGVQLGILASNRPAEILNY